MITNSRTWPVFYDDILFCRLWMKSMHSFKSYWSETNILTQQQKLSTKRAITQPKFDGWLPISNLTCILQWYKLLQTLNKINAFLQKIRNEKCDEDVADDDMIPMCLPCYASDTKRRGAGGVNIARGPPLRSTILTNHIKIFPSRWK